MSQWIETVSGKQFHILCPQTADVDIEDIAHALSHLCRFTGHCKVFYSVAQHCVLASRYCPEEPLWALLHDAAEAYLGDVSRPLKQALPEYSELEQKVQRVIFDRFGLYWPMPSWIKEVDNRMLATERRDLMSISDNYWISTERVEPFESTVIAWDALTARHEFLVRFSELY